MDLPKTLFHGQNVINLAFSRWLFRSHTGFLRVCSQTAIESIKKRHFARDHKLFKKQNTLTASALPTLNFDRTFHSYTTLYARFTC